MRCESELSLLYELKGTWCAVPINTCYFLSCTNLIYLRTRIRMDAGCVSKPSQQIQRGISLVQVPRLRYMFDFWG